MLGVLLLYPIIIVDFIGVNHTTVQETLHPMEQYFDVTHLNNDP